MIKMVTKTVILRLWLLRVLAVMIIGCTFGVAVPVFARGVSTGAGPEGPAQTVYAPAGEKPAPVIIAISGNRGPTLYQDYAADLAKLGYYTVLLDGKDILNSEHTGPSNLSKAIDRAQHSPKALPGKVAVIGFSLGGGGTLCNAANLHDAVSMVVAYYPLTRIWANDMDSFVKGFQVPVMVLAGELDHEANDCCVVESMRAMEASAKAVGTQFELVVYPEAGHSFNLAKDMKGKPSLAYRAKDASDAWRRTVEMLNHYQPLQ